LSENSSNIFIIADPVSQFKNTPSLDLVTSTLSLDNYNYTYFLNAQNVYLEHP
jgi:hypothetical protein